jgi:predicted transcriptional regulator of viral defense system
MAGPTHVIRKLARQKGLVRLRDAQARGIHPEYLRRLASKGELARVGRGLYALPDAEIWPKSRHACPRASSAC